MYALKHLPHYTYADYEKWEGDWELIDGIPYAMSPSPMKKHSLVGIAIISALHNALNEKKTTCDHCELVYELDWIINDDTVLRPDIAIICNAKDNFIKSPPILIVEILSPATALKDRQVKYEIYQAQRVKYYILVNPNDQTFDVYVLDGNEYVLENNTLIFDLHENCNIRIDLSAILANSGL